MRRIDATERRARLAVRHRLAPEARASDPVQAAAAVVALHATDPASVFLSAWARMADGSVEAVERALYEDRTLLRMLAMRRTVWVVPAVDAPVVQAGASDTVAERERRKLLAALEEADVAPDADAWLREVEAVALRILAGREALTAAELSRADPRLATELVLARGKNYEGRQKVASRVLLVLAASGLAVRARPRGSWSSSQFRWTALEAWCPEAAVRHEAETAETELARRWLAAFGPATVEDLRWWTGWTLGVTRRALAGVDTVDVELDGGASGLVAAADAAPPPPVEPWAALLPALDPTTMGWKTRDWYLGDLGPEVFDGAGNASPTVWWDGRVVGGWARRADGTVVHELLVDVGADARDAIERAAADLEARVADVRLAPRARAASPVERRLVA